MTPTLTPYFLLFLSLYTLYSTPSILIPFTSNVSGQAEEEAEMGYFEMLQSHQFIAIFVKFSSAATKYHTCILKSTTIFYIFFIYILSILKAFI